MDSSKKAPLADKLPVAPCALEWKEIFKVIAGRDTRTYLKIGRALTVIPACRKRASRIS